MVVTGGPERVICMWDPRTGRRIGKLVGRTVPTTFARLLFLKTQDSWVESSPFPTLISDSPLQLLMASADGILCYHTPRWRCLHTFTRHTDSVFALPALQRSLEIFHSGDKSGFVSKVDVEGHTDMSEVLVCQDVAPPAEVVTKLVALDDLLVWTAEARVSRYRPAWPSAPPRS